MPIATLSIDLEARLAKLEQGMDKAGRIAERNAARIEKSFAGVNNTLRDAKQLLGTYVSARFFEGLVLGAIDAQDNLKDLAKRTQTSIEEIGGIGFAGKMAGADLESVGQSVGKLNLALAKAGQGDKAVLDVFAKMGVAALDASGKARKAADILPELADKFRSYEDGPEKAALGNALFGKSYQTLLPLLDEGGAALRENSEYWNRYSGVTTESAEAADAFNDKLEKLRLHQQAIGNELAGKLLPTMDSLVDLFVDAREKGTGVSTMTDGMASAFEGLIQVGTYVVTQLASIGKTIGYLAAQTANFLDAANESTKNLTFGQAITNPIGSLIDVWKAGRTGFSATTDAYLEDMERLQKGYNDVMARIGRPKGGVDNPFANPLFDSAGSRGDGRGRKRAPTIDKDAGKATRERTTDIERLIQRLQDQVVAERAAKEEWTEVEKVTEKLATDPKLKDITGPQRASALALAQQLDALRAKLEFTETALTLFRRSEIEGTEAVAESMRQLKLAEEEHATALRRGAPERGQLEETRKDIQILTDEFTAGRLEVDEYTRAVQARLGTLPENFEVALTTMEELAISAAAGIDDALGGTIEDLIGGHFDNIGDRWKHLLEQMAVQALHAELSKALFGDMRTGGGIGGLAGSIFPALLGLGGRAGGGSMRPYQAARVNENGPEVASVGGRDYMLNGGSWATVKALAAGSSKGDVHVHIAGGISRNEVSALIPQIKAAVKAEMASDMRRPGFNGG